MEKKLFDRLAESMTQMDEIVRGELQASREFTVGAGQEKAWDGTAKEGQAGA